MSALWLFEIERPDELHEHGGRLTLAEVVQTYPDMRATWPTMKVGEAREIAGAGAAPRTIVRRVS